LKQIIRIEEAGKSVNSPEEFQDGRSLGVAHVEAGYEVIREGSWVNKGELSRWRELVSKGSVCGSADPVPEVMSQNGFYIARKRSCC
jgi:hypothetical protein